MSSISQSVAAGRPIAITGPKGLIDKYFYFAMSLLIAAIVVSGFRLTVNANLLHPSIPRPLILWFHAAAFTSWVGFFIFQSALVRTHNVKGHRFFGWFGAALGTVMVPLGITTSIVMGRFDTTAEHIPGSDAFLIVPFYDMLAFGIFFTLAILWRRKPELHRRLLFIATCGLLVNRRVHKVYVAALPALFVVQAFVTYTWMSTSAWWVRIAHSILGV